MVGGGEDVVVHENVGRSVQVFPLPHERVHHLAQVVGEHGEQRRVGVAGEHGGEETRGVFEEL